MNPPIHCPAHDRTGRCSDGGSERKPDSDPPPALAQSATGGSPTGDPWHIGRYRVIRLLGRAASAASIWPSDDDLNRSVAIKVPNPRADHLAARSGSVPERSPYPCAISIIPISCLFMTWGAPTTVCATSCPSTSRAATWRPGSRRLDPVSASRRNWWRRSPKPALRSYARAGPPGHQARQHPDRSPRASRSSPTSVWHCKDEDFGKGAGLPELLRT